MVWYVDTYPPVGRTMDSPLRLLALFTDGGVVSDHIMTGQPAPLYCDPHRELSCREGYHTPIGILVVARVVAMVVAERCATLNAVARRDNTQGKISSRCVWCCSAHAHVRELGARRVRGRRRRLLRVYEALRETAKNS